MPNNQNSNTQKSRCEIRLGEDGILRNVIIGNLDGKTTEEFVQKLLKLLEEAPGKIDSLTDLSQCEIASAPARKIFMQLMKHKKMGKTAMFGASVPVRIMANVMLKIAGVGHVKYFSTEEEALEWLKGNTNKRNLEE